MQYKEYDDALKKFKIATDQKPDHQQAWQNAILMLGEVGKYEFLTIEGLAGVSILTRVNFNPSHLNHGRREKIKLLFLHCFVVPQKVL